MSPLPLWDDVLQDPSFANFSLSKETIRELSREHISTLGNSGRDRDQNLSNQKQQYTDLLVSYYSQLNGIPDKKQESSEKLSKWKALLRVWSFHLFENSADPKEKDLYRFHNFLFSFNESEADLAHYFEGKNSLSHSDLDSSRKRLISLVRLLTQLYDVDIKTRNHAIARLNHISIDLEKKAYILIQLYLARLKAGFTPRGKKVSPSHPGYRYHLRAISDLCNSISPEKNSGILSAIMSVWVKADDFSDSWFNLPFNSSCYKKTFPYQVVLERQALLYYNQKNYQKSWQLYRLITENITDEDILKLVKNRILAVARKIYQENGSAAILHQELLSSVKESDRKEVARLWDELYHLTMDELNTALNTTRSLMETVPLALDFLKAAGQTREKERAEVRWTLARVYEKYGKIQESLDQYLILSDTKDRNAQSSALKESVRLQCDLLGWDYENPWNFAPGASTRDFSRLLDLLERRQTLLPGPESWSVAKNLASLLVLAGKEDRAYEIVKPLWTSVAGKKEAAKMMGLLVTRFHEEKKYEPSSDIITDAYSRKIRPEYQGRPLYLPELLRKSIWAMALSLFQQKKFREVAGQADRYLLIYGDSHKDHSLIYLKARAFQAYSEYKQAEMTLAGIFSKGVPEFPEQKSALRDLFHLYRGMGNFEKMLNTAALLQKRYPGEESIEREREKVCGFYTHPLCQTRKPQALESGEPEEQLFSDVEGMIKRRDRVSLDKTEKKFPDHQFNKETNQELLYFVWYGQLKILAENRLERWKKRTRPHALKSLTEGYRNLKQLFMDFCQHPENGYCLAALFDLHRFLQDQGNIKIGDSGKKSPDAWKLHCDKEKSILRQLVEDRLSSGDHSPWITEKAWWMLGRTLQPLGGSYSGTGFVQIRREVSSANVL